MARHAPIPATLLSRSMLPCRTGGMADVDTLWRSVRRDGRTFRYSPSCLSSGRVIFASRTIGGHNTSPVDLCAARLADVRADIRHALIISGESSSVARVRVAYMSRGAAPGALIRQTARAI